MTFTRTPQGGRGTDRRLARRSRAIVGFMLPFFVLARVEAWERTLFQFSR
jgi:hypothetical protein